MCFQYSSDETEALSRQGFDKALLVARIADRAPSSIQPGSQRSIGHAAPVPDRIDQVVLADDAPPVADQIIEQIEYLWRDRYDGGPALQFAQVRVECVVFEKKAQSLNPWALTPVAAQRIIRR